LTPSCLGPKVVSIATVLQPLSERESWTSRLPSLRLDDESVVTAGNQNISIKCSDFSDASLARLRNRFQSLGVGDIHKKVMEMSVRATLLVDIHGPWHKTIPLQIQGVPSSIPTWP
jgi:hypothetical protein